MREDRRLDNKDRMPIAARFEDYAKFLNDESMSINDIREAEGLQPLNQGSEKTTDETD